MIFDLKQTLRGILLVNRCAWKEKDNKVTTAHTWRAWMPAPKLKKGAELLMEPRLALQGAGEQKARCETEDLLSVATNRPHQIESWKHYTLSMMLKTRME